MNVAAAAIFPDARVGRERELDLHGLQVGGTHERRLTDINHDLMAEVALSTGERLQWKSADGTPIEGWVLKPRGYDAARLFVITWDPLAGMVERPSGFATTIGVSADLEIVIYLPTWSLVRMATARHSTLAAVMGADGVMLAAASALTPARRARASGPRTAMMVR